MDVKTEVTDKIRDSEDDVSSLTAQFKVPFINYTSGKYKFFRGNLAFEPNKNPQEQVECTKNLLEEAIKNGINDATALDKILASLGIGK